MEAIRALTYGDLPPVGRSIICKSLNTELPNFDGYNSTWVNSGTSALALALLSAKKLRKDILEPEVIIPGYCCPDLISAAHYAKVKPVVVDINIDDPSFHIETLKSVLSHRSLAIVAVNFLGVAENLDALLAIKMEYPELIIIEDNAQWFPTQSEYSLLKGDFVSFSFGRGKPISLLGGGLLLTKKNWVINNSSEVINAKSSNYFSQGLLCAKYLAYNQMLSPFWYQFINRNPFFTLGKTEYHQLKEIMQLDVLRYSLLTANIDNYESVGRSIEFAYDDLFAGSANFNSFKFLLTSRRKRLLRYPYLFSTLDQKNRIFPELIKYGLGASEMYKTSLPYVSGVKDLQVIGGLDNSTSFAQRFITLPLHPRVSKRHLDLINKIFTSN